MLSRSAPPRSVLRLRDDTRSRIAGKQPSSVHADVRKTVAERRSRHSKPQNLFVTKWPSEPGEFEPILVLLTDFDADHLTGLSVRSVALRAHP